MKNSDTNMTGILVRKGIWCTEMQRDDPREDTGEKTASTKERGLRRDIPC